MLKLKQNEQMITGLILHATYAGNAGYYANKENIDRIQVLMGNSCKSLLGKQFVPDKWTSFETIIQKCTISCRDV